MEFTVSKAVTDLVSQQDLTPADAAAVKIFRRSDTYIMTKPNRVEMALHRLACLLRIENEVKNENVVEFNLVTGQKIDEHFINACIKLSSLSLNDEIKAVYKKFLIRAKEFER